MNGFSLSQSVMSKISVRFLIDKEQKRVVLAEAGSDFVDVLFSFLTLPLGSIVRLLGKKSGLESLDNLYESVEKLDTKYLTEACKEILVNPRSTAAELCEDLKIKSIHYADPRNNYTCKQTNCLIQSTCYYTYATKGRCRRCGELMNEHWTWRKIVAADKGGVFLKDTGNFIIADDLRVIPMDTMKMGFSLLEELQIKDVSILEERVIDFSTEEALNLLRMSLGSKNALTEVCFPDASVQTTVNCFLAIKKEADANETEKEIILNLIINKKNNDVLYAEAGEDFINQLLSFLTYPVGSVLRLLSDNISIDSCISNLYSSAESMELNYFKSENCRNMLLAPKLPTFYGFKDQILKLEEITSRKWSVSSGCTKCYKDNGYKASAVNPCVHGIKQAEFIEQNPKSAKGLTDAGEAFVVESRRFVVADNLHISPLSFISAIDNKMNSLTISDLIWKKVCVDKSKFLSLLNSMLISNSVMTDVFCPKQAREEKPTSVE